MIYGFIPAVTLLIGGLLALVYAPSPKLRTAIQHFAGGLILSAVAAEIIPELIDDKDYIPQLIGFAFGIGLMISVQSFGRQVGSDPSKSLLAKLTVRGIPIFLDGLLVGIALAAGLGAFVITFAISIEQVFVGLAAAAALLRFQLSKQRLFLLILLLAAVFAAGSWLGYQVIAQAGHLALDTALAMATATMLFVVIEEMLRDAHENNQAESVSSQLAFFAGFLLTIVLAHFE